MKYLITYAAIDSEYGNPLWHSFILLSLAEEGKPIEVDDVWGYYGLPTTSPNSCWGRVKIWLKVDVDLTGNHGMLRHEDYRYIDRGSALHGVTFEVTEEKYKKLKEKCQNFAAAQDNAIREAVIALNLTAKPKYRIYPYEQHSRQIFEWETQKAQDEKRESRLKPFEFRLQPYYYRVTTRNSYTCKTQITSILQGILTEEQVNRISEKGKHPTIPRLSGRMENFFLHSTGPLSSYHSKTHNKKVYFRDGSDHNVKLHWTLPPQEIENLDKSTKVAPRRNVEQAKKAIHQLQKIYWVIMDANGLEEYAEQKKLLIDHLEKHYVAFSVIHDKESKQYNPKIFSISPVAKINNANTVLNNLYEAIINSWSFDMNKPEALASYLKEEDQRKICKLLNRRYIEPDVDNLLVRDEEPSQLRSVSR